MKTWRWFGFCLCAAWLGCGGDDSDDAASAGSGGSQAGVGAAGAGSGGKSAAAGSGGGAAGKAGAGKGGAGGAAAGSGGSGGSQAGNAQKLKLSIVARDVPPDGQEHVCVVVELPNDEPIWVNRVDAVLSGGSHHLIVDRKPADTDLNSEPEVCAPTMASDSSRLIIAQQAKTEVKLPAGVAFKLDAHQRVFMQLHYFNAGDDAHDIRGDVELSLVDASAKKPIEAKTVFTGATSISIAPHSDSEVTAFVKPQAGSGTRRLFALTSHTHRLGVRSTIERVASSSAATVTPLHESTNWSEPPLTFFDPPLRFDGSDRLRLICRYRNETDETVTFGVEAQDEMCFMWLYYYDEP